MTTTHPEEDDLDVVEPLLVVTTFLWFTLGLLVGPFLVPKHTDVGLIRSMIIITAFCTYFFWLIAYLCQLNPLFGPRLSTKVITAMRREWTGA